MIKEVKLSDICIINGLQTGPFGSQLKADEYKDIADNLGFEL